MEDPHVLLRRLKLGREEYCQRLLTMLILDAPYPRWNSRSKPSVEGLQFLRRLDEMSFGQSDLDERTEFVDELDLPARNEAEKGAAPDYGVIGPDRLWIIELKTEVPSHRSAQVPTYFDLGRHHHPGRQIDLTYMTPAMEYTPSQPPEGSRFAHVTWDGIEPLIREVWGHRTGFPASVREALVETLGTMGRPWMEWREATLDDVVGLAVRQGKTHRRRRPAAGARTSRRLVGRAPGTPGRSARRLACIR